MISQHLPQLLLAWSIQLTGVLSPGPSVALILGVATGQGRPAALVTATGVACGTIVLCVSTVLGLTVVLSKFAGLMEVIRLVGACYLVWLAWNSFRKAASPPPLVLAQRQSGSPLRTGISGFLLQITNPKAIFFWLAIAGIGGVGDAPWPVVALFVAGSFANSWIGHGGYALLLSSPPFRRLYAAGRRWIEGALGCFFLFAGWRLATTRL